VKHDEDYLDRTNPQLLRLEEVAVILKISFRGVERFIAAGEIRVTRLSKRIRRVSITDLQDFVERMKENTS
jgi:excisionase family DNA binding protein